MNWPSWANGCGVILTAVQAWARGLAPLEVRDANGVRIRRMITAIDTVTGRVESFVLDALGQTIPTRLGTFKRRVERYPAPLLWRSVAHLPEDYWDKDGR